VDSQAASTSISPSGVWLYPSVPMAVTAEMSIELETLAINLLTPLTRARDYRAAVGVTLQAREEAGEPVLRGMFADRAVAGLVIAALNDPGMGSPRVLAFKAAHSVRAHLK